MHRGYIKIWRKVEDSGLLQMHSTFALFMHMLIQSTHKPMRVGTAIGMVDLDRGQLISGRHKLAANLGLTEQKTRTCLDRLHEMGMITSKPTSKFTVYSIVNYNNYQDIDQQDNQQGNQQDNQQGNQPKVSKLAVQQSIDNQQITSRITNNQPTDNQQITTIQELKTQEEIKPSSATDVAALDEKQIYSKAFIAFWELYPIRVNKGAAFKAFQKIRAAEYPVVRAGLERKKQSQAWLKDNGKFIPHAATWLNARGWEDEDAPAATPVKPTYRAKTQAEMDAEQEQRRVEMEERKRKILAMPVESNPWEASHV